MNLFNTTCVALITLKSYTYHGTWNIPNNPICYICKDNKKPGNKYGAAAILLPGKDQSQIFTCTQLHQMGLTHRITSQMCKPIKYYMANICGCGQDPQSFDSDWTIKTP